MKKTKNLSAHWRGFTLTELLLYMGLTVIFLGVLTDIFVTTLDVKKESEATSAVEIDGRFIFLRLMYDVNHADGVTAPAALGESSTILTLDLDGVSDTFSFTNDNLTLNGAKLNSSESKISAGSFQKLGNVDGKASVQIKFTVTSVTQRPKGPELRDYQITLSTR